MKRVLPLFLFIIIFILFPVSCAKAATINVMNYNINREDNDNNAAWVDNQMMNLAKYLKAKNVDLVGLQEVHDWQNAPTNTSSNLKYDDADLLDNYLDQFGYPMYQVTVPWAKGIGVDFRPVIFSKYPPKPGTFYNFIITGNTNKYNQITAAFDTPIGEVQFFDIHQWHGADNCFGLNWMDSEIFTKKYGYAPNLLMVGDWNITVLTIPKADPNKQCNIPWRSRYINYCESLTNCGIADYKNLVDFIFSPNGTKFKLVGNVTFDQIYSPEYNGRQISDHALQLATLTTDAVVTPLPTPSPTISPTNGVGVWGDMDNNNVLDLKDIFLLIKKVFL